VLQAMGMLRTVCSARGFIERGKQNACVSLQSSLSAMVSGTAPQQTMWIRCAQARCARPCSVTGQRMAMPLQLDAYGKVGSERSGATTDVAAHQWARILPRSPSPAGGLARTAGASMVKSSAMGADMAAAPAGALSITVRRLTQPTDCSARRVLLGPRSRAVERRMRGRGDGWSLRRSAAGADGEQSGVRAPGG